MNAPKSAASRNQPANAEPSGLKGHQLLEHPLMNEGSAFTEADRRRLGLLGLLPYHSSTVEEQLTRVYENYKRKENDLERYIFLNGLQDRNEALFDDPLYLGWRHRRVRGEDYDRFIEAFVQAVMQKFPNVLLQWEDFSKHNAPRILERYRDRLCTFNDDIQGTGAVTVAGLLAATKVTKTNLTDQRIVILGAGASAIGICDQIVAGMKGEGISPDQAKKSLWLVDSKGLVHDRRPAEPFKEKYAQPIALTENWQIDD